MWLNQMGWKCERLPTSLTNRLSPPRPAKSPLIRNCPPLVATAVLSRLSRTRPPDTIEVTVVPSWSCSSGVATALMSEMVSREIR
jgi:hypothetical protein